MGRREVSEKETEENDTSMNLLASTITNIFIFL